MKKQKTMRSLRSSLIFLLATLFAVATALNFVKQNAKADGAPTTPPANICGNTSLLSGPSTAPNGAVTVAAGDNTSAAAAGDYDSANTTYYFATGTHTIEAQIIPGNNSTYIGAPGAIIDGGGTENNEWSQSATNVTVEYLTIQNYWQPGGQDVVNANQGANRTFEYDTIGPNNPNGQASYNGYGIGLGDGNTLEHDCITGNSEGGFNASGGPGNLLTGVVISNDEITANGLGNYPDTSGTAAGGKIFWSTNAVITDNYVHGNYGVGIWADFNNAGADISGNYISANYNSAINYEASYNANISDNTIVGNGWASAGAWPACSGESYSCTNGAGPVDGSTYDNPYAAIYISNSGGDSTLATNYSGELLVENNVLTDNFGGVGIFQDRNRFCGSPVQENCTLQQANALYYDNPTISATDAVENGTATITSSAGFFNTQTNSVTAPTVGALVLGSNIPANDTIYSVTNAHNITLTTAASGSGTGLDIDTGTAGGCGLYDLNGATKGSNSGSPSDPYFSECNWNAQNITLSGNTYSLNSATVTGCSTSDNRCGYMTLWANEGACVTGCETWSPYQGTTIMDDVTTQNNNVWENNTYIWRGSGNWQFWDGNQNGLVSYDTWQAAPYSQDANSNSYINPTPSTPTNVATSVSGTTVTVSWDPSTESSGPAIAGYYVFRTQGNNSPINLTPDGLTVAEAGDPSFTDTSGNPNTSYAYNIESYDTLDDVSGQSGSASATTGSTASTNGTGTNTGSSSTGTTTVPKAPNTGLALIYKNPFIVLFGSLTVAAGLLFVSFRVKKRAALKR